MISVLGVIAHAQKPVTIEMVKQTKGHKAVKAPKIKVGRQKENIKNN